MLLTIIIFVKNKNIKSMKKLICASLLAVLMVSNGCGLMSGVKADETQRSMEVIFDFPNKTNDQLYILANTWFVEYFNSDESIIEFQDKENGKIAGKYTFQHGNGIYYYMIIMFGITYISITQ